MIENVSKALVYVFIVYSVSLTSLLVLGALAKALYGPEARGWVESASPLFITLAASGFAALIGAFVHVRRR